MRRRADELVTAAWQLSRAGETLVQPTHGLNVASVHSMLERSATGLLPEPDTDVDEPCPFAMNCTNGRMPVPLLEQACCWQDIAISWKMGAQAWRGYAQKERIGELGMEQPVWIWMATFGIALLGAVLGVINTVRSMWRDRVKIRAVPVYQGRLLQVRDGRVGRVVTEFAHNLDNFPDGVVGIRVTNLGFLEVTIANVGFTASNLVTRHRRSLFRRIPILDDAGGAVTFPRVLKPRESINVWAAGFDDVGFVDRLRTITRVYATTDCGVDVFGTSGLLRALRRRARHVKRDPAP